MSLRQVIPIYHCDEMYLYEIMEDFKQAKTQEEKNEIFNSFCSSIWSSDNKRRTYIKTIHFNVRKDLLNTELGRVFHTWSEVEYKHYKSMTKDDNWRSLIRQKINNIYTNYFDKEVILGKQYMDLLKTPKRLYYEWLAGIDMDADTVTELIDNAMSESEKAKQRLQAEKLSLAWNAYKEVMEGFLFKCFKNCKLIEEYEDKKSISNQFDFFTEDYFYVGYINRSIEAYMKNYQKEVYGLKRGRNKQYKRCRQCGALMEKTGRNKQYCTVCKQEKRRQTNHNYYIKTVLKS